MLTNLSVFKLFHHNLLVPLSRQTLLSCSALPLLLTFTGASRMDFFNLPVLLWGKSKPGVALGQTIFPFELLLGVVLFLVVVRQSHPRPAQTKIEIYFIVDRQFNYYTYFPPSVLCVASRPKLWRPLPQWELGRPSTQQKGTRRTSWKTRDLIFVVLANILFYL